MKISLYKMGDLKELIRESDVIISEKIRDCYMAVYRGESEGDELKVLAKIEKDYTICGEELERDIGN